MFSFLINGVCFSQSITSKIQKPLGPNHGGISLDTVFFLNETQILYDPSKFLFCRARMINEKTHTPRLCFVSLSSVHVQTRALSS